MRLSLLVAVSTNGVIGANNSLLWHLPEDLKRFKRLTMGHPILMGRKTFDSIGRVLPGRTSIVLTRSEGYDVPGVLKAGTLSEAIGLAAQKDAYEAFIIGGGEVYRQALEEGVVNRIYLTRVYTELAGDTFFEIPDINQWEVTSHISHPSDNSHAYAFDFIDLTQKD